MTDLIIRRARPEDAEEIARMVQALNMQEEGFAGATDAEVIRRHGFGDDPSFTLFVADLAGQVCGYAMICLRIFNSEHAMRGGYLLELWVDEVARGKGAAKGLVSAGCALVKEDGGEFLEWFSNLHNDRANSVYTKFGAQRDKLYAHALHPKEFEAFAAGGKGSL